MTVTQDVSATITALRREVCALHSELTRYQLVVWTAGNVSARVPGQDLLVIKPSGVSYDDLTPENMVVCDLQGRVVEGEHSPSSDTAAQAYVYREMPQVGGGKIECQEAANAVARYEEEIAELAIRVREKVIENE
jgi:L-ribulose-5-phosphate 4-epimerase